MELKVAADGDPLVEVQPGFTCGHCNQHPIAGPRFLCEGGGPNTVLISCQSCFLQLPDEYKSKFFLAALTPDPLKNTRLRIIAAEKRPKVKKGFCDLLTFLIRENPWHIMRRMYGGVRGQAAYHLDSQCRNGCGERPIHGWMFECYDCEDFSICQQCCLNPVGVRRQHNPEHDAFIAAHAGKLRDVLLTDLLCLAIYVCCFAVVFYFSLWLARPRSHY